MQYLILAGMTAAIILIILAVLNVVKKKNKKRLIIFILLFIIILALIIWYFIPIVHEIPNSQDVTINIYYTFGDKYIKCTDIQKEDILTLINALKFKREFFDGYKDIHIDNSKYVYISIYNNEAADDIYFHLGLHVVVNEDGNKTGLCFDNQYATAINPNELIAYIGSLLSN